MNKEDVQFKGTPASGEWLAWGEISVLGWDIPVRWVVDADRQCWADLTAHGFPMVPVSASTLLSEASEDSGSDVEIRRVLGLKPKLPSWVAIALHHGWTPPETFNRADYE